MIVLTVSLLLGCAMRKQVTHERVAAHVGKQTVSKMESEYQRFGQGSIRSVWLENATTVAEIIPLGTFRLSADSGFIGEAQRVVVGQEIRQVHASASNSAAVEVGSEVATLTKSETAVIQRNTAVSDQLRKVPPQWRVPWWVWLLGVLLVIGGMRYLCRRR